MIDQLIVTLVGLGLLGGGYLLWLLTGIVNAVVNTKQWSWRKTATDVAKALLMGVVILGLVALSNGIDWYAGLLGFDVSAFTDGMSTVVMLGGIVAGIATYYGRAMKNAMNFFKLPTEVKPVGEQNYKQIANDVKNAAKEFADKITPFFTANEEQTSVEAAFDAEEVEVGQGADVNPLTRRLPDGDKDGSKGWQCSKYSWYLASGVRMNYAPSPDFGPCNGNAMVDYLINKLGWVKCGKINGAIFAYNTGSYGHTGMVVDAANNMVNDANWTPLTVSTHYLNLDAVGAVYCCPKSMVNQSTPAPQPAAKKSVQEIADEVIAGKWGNGDERKTKLKNAGYNPDEVQAIVNAKLAPKTAPKETKQAATFAVGDTVIPTKLVDYAGHQLIQYDPSYTIIQLNGNRAVLSARGQVWAACNTNSIKKV